MERIKESTIQSFETEHINRVRNIGGECAVLLKSDGSFPLASPCPIAAYGSGVRRTVKGGTGSGDVNVRHFVTVEEGLLNAGFSITSSTWLDRYDQVMADAKKAFSQYIQQRAAELGVNPIMFGMGQPMPEPDYEIPLVAEGDTAIYVLSRKSGEGADRKAEAGDILLSQTEIRDILTLNERCARFMLVLNVGGMVDLSPVDAVKNILILSQLGTPTGDVLADLLLGKSVPSGKLAMTWAPIDAYPSTEGFGNPDDTVYAEGIYVGYRYFDTAGIVPVYPFGFGLSYTSFALSETTITADETRVTLSALVKNTGKHPGKEVVQVYVSAPDGKLEKPFQELRGFAKTSMLKPGEEETVTVSFETSDLASYDESTSAWILEKGDYVLRVGTDSGSAAPAAVLRLDQTVTLCQLRKICAVEGLEELHLSRKAAPAEQLPILPLHAEKYAQQTVSYSNPPAEIACVNTPDWQKVVAGEQTVEQFAAGLSEKQLALLCIGRYDENPSPMSAIGAASTALAGGAGETTDRLSDLGIPTLAMADGPAGIRVSTQYKLLGKGVKSLDNPLAMFMDFVTPEQLQMMAERIPAPSEEEKNAPIYYQYCTAIPIGTALAQSWNPEICRTCGDLVGEEMSRFGVSLWLAPAQNIQRSPLCGRDFEYYSEDPLLSGLCAAAVTEGVQRHPGRGSTVKHFAANNQETNRYVSNSIVSERALREIYLKSFEVSIRACEPHALMTSYNLINGEHACNRYDLLTAVLRDEWGYAGLVMTDWYVTTNMLSGGTGRQNKHPQASAAGCVKAGTDLTMPGAGSDLEDILNALHQSEHSYAPTRAELQRCAVRVLWKILQMHDIETA